MKIQRSISIDAPIEAVWRIIASHYADVGKWARAVQSSAPNENTEPLNGSPVGGRVCQTDIGPATEKLTVFDPKSYHLTYKAHADKMPFFVKALYGDWRLNSERSKTEVNFGFSADLSAPFSFFMPILMGPQFKTPIENTLEDLKALLETGRTHPEKGGELLEDLFSVDA